MKFLSGILTGLFLVGFAVAGLQACRAFAIWVGNPSDRTALTTFAAFTLGCLLEVSCAALVVRMGRTWQLR